MVEELKTKNEEVENHLQETKAKVTSGNNELTILKKANEDLKTKIEGLQTENKGLKTSYEGLKDKNNDLKTEINDLKSKYEAYENKNEDLKTENEDLKIEVEKLEDERDAEMNKCLQYQSENVSNLKRILELETTQAKLTSDLEDCKIHRQKSCEEKYVVQLNIFI